ncbi:hypothetical protein WISP_136300 [Willisornis vidua]|uniref:Uncharacterized protein n=1 Tax=Willisornis vidua TaxID=1566151 RepID=A0ABQ9CTJ3_9PASS|nr:hypothetical protein WISP_136300 [Willisornis vidua]
MVLSAVSFFLKTDSAYVLKGSSRIVNDVSPRIPIGGQSGPLMAVNMASQRSLVSGFLLLPNPYTIQTLTIEEYRSEIIHLMFS